ncbi:MAG: hypothetical protein M1819_004405 [Sarea resinae]|nr:MAG: hypothetical protein M1819_004405 [Sarea resinae]
MNMGNGHAEASGVNYYDNGKSPVQTQTAKTEDSFYDRDEREMATLGKKQVLKRNFGFMSMLGFSCTLMITWEGIFSVFVDGLEDGGPGGLIYGAPTSGGQYHWTFLFSPPKYRKFFSFITGWQSVLAWQACLASAAYLAGTMIQGLMVLNHPDYDFKRWHGTLLLYAVMLLALFFNTYLADHLPKVEGAVLTLHILGFFGILIPMTYLAPHGNAHDVFATFLNLGGYHSMGLSFFVGIITTVFAFLGADGAVHMCEEIKNASTVVPQSLMASIALNGVLGFSMLIAILFCVGDIQNALSSPTGYPFIEIFQQATESTGGATAMASIVLSLMIFATIAVLAAASRIMWAFARDNGLPGSRWLRRVEPRTKLPLYAIACTTLITLLLALINIGSSAAFNAVASLLVAGFLGSYLLPISLLLGKRLRGDAIPYGPWKMGRLVGPLTNAFALLWCLIAMVFSFFPTTVPVTLQTMNWSCLLWGAAMIFGVVYYIFRGRFQYHGPILETSLMEQMQGIET